jgi:hypothetical protein
MISTARSTYPAINNSKMGNGIYFKIAGYVDFDMLNMFAV